MSKLAVWQLGPDLAVETREDSPLLEAIDTVFAPMRARAKGTSGRKCLVDLDARAHPAQRLCINGLPAVTIRTQREAAPLAESILTHCAARSARRCAVFHAGLVTLDGKGVLLPGERTCGKSTMSLWLAEQGGTYYGDDLTFIGLEDSLVYPFPKAGTLKSGSFDLFPDSPTHDDPVRGILRYHIPSRVAGDPLPLEKVCRIVFPEYDPDCRAEVRDVEPEIAALALVQQTFGGLEQDPGMIGLVKKLSEIPASHARYSDLEAVESAIRSLIE